LQPKRYTEKQKTALIKLAQDVGINKACKELGYPSYAMACRWFDDRGLQRPRSVIQAEAAITKQLYSATDKLIVCQAELDRINELLIEGGLQANELKLLADALKRTAEAMNLIEGKATSIAERIDSNAFDTSLLELFDTQEPVPNE
jgi:hypothetical protein